MAFMARRLVSTNKRRYQEDGFDLDLSYITPRVIAMGFPCDGISSLYRNPVRQVARFLDERHAGLYRVYNLCVERGYDVGVFGGRVLRLPMFDGQAPPLHLLLALARDAAAWLAADPRAVVAVHCKAGKGRTGAAVCALLLALERQLTAASLDGVLALWARQRTRDGKGLTIASQKRSVCYFHAMLLSAAQAAAAAAPALAPPAPLPGASSAAAAAATLGNASPTGPSPPPPSPPATAANGAAHANGVASTAAAADLPQHAAPHAHAPAAVPPHTDLLHHTAVPHRAVRLLRLRLRGLPPWLLRRGVTLSVFVRPPGHHEAHPVCHAHGGGGGGGGGGGAAGCLRDPEAGSPSTAPGAQEGGAPAARAPLLALRPHAPAGGGQQELLADLSALPPFPSPPPPTPLPYFPAPAVSQSPTPTHTAQPSATTQQQRPSQPTPAAAAPGPPLLTGDIKLQLFRGRLQAPPAHVYNGSVTQFAAWLSTAFLEPGGAFGGKNGGGTFLAGSDPSGPRVGVLTLSRPDLDKVSKPLRRWRGDLELVVEYEMV